MMRTKEKGEQFFVTCNKDEEISCSNVKLRVNWVRRKKMHPVNIHNVLLLLMHSNHAGWLQRS